MRTIRDILEMIVFAVIWLFVYSFLEQWICPVPFRQPIFSPLKITCNECGHIHKTGMYDIINKVPNIFIQSYWNNYENCPKCGKKNWTVESVYQHIIVF